MEASSFQQRRQKTLICEAAILLVQEAGAERLTLEAVAAAADVELSVVQVHYPSIDNLIVDVVPGLFAAMLARVAEIQGSDDRPGAWLKAYINAHFPEDGEDNFTRIVAALLSSASLKPEFVTGVVDKQEEVHAAMLNDGIDPGIACIIRAACDGLWMAQVFNVDIVPSTRQRQTVDDLLQMVDDMAARSQAER